MVIKPIILIVPNYNVDEKSYTLNSKYCKMVLKNGGIPIISSYVNIENMKLLLNNVSGVILTGGGDVSPRFINSDAVFSNNCNEQRDIFEINLCRLCFEKFIPIMGICRGMQVLCVAAGGKISEDTSLFSKNTVNHMQSINKDIPSHKVTIKRKSILYNVLKRDNIYVNSFHHQCVERCGFLKPVAFSSDGIIEAVENNDKNIVMGFQWHPEHCVYGGYSDEIFNFFINKCK